MMEQVVLSQLSTVKMVQEAITVTYPAPKS